MAMIKVRWKSLKSFFIGLIIFISILYTSIAFFSRSDQCSQYYSSDSFEICAVVTEQCNFSLLIDSYLQYRRCALEHSSNNVNYVVFEAVNGLGNRLLGLVSVTTYALITGRVLLIDWQPGDNHPTYFDALFYPLSTSTSTLSPSRISFYRLIHLIRYRWINQIQSRFPSNRIPKDWSFYFDRDLLCQDQTDQYQWYEHITLKLLNWIGDRVKWMRTDQYFLPLLIRNVQKKQAFLKLVPDGQIFSKLAPKLLRPLEKVHKIIRKFREKYSFDQEMITIGVHMRSWSSSITDQTEPFQHCIENLLKNLTQFGNETQRIGLYIISNTIPRRNRLKDYFITRYPQRVTIFDPPQGSSAADEVEMMQCTLAELMILSEMQHLIITSKSTFGMVAQGFAGRGAWIVWQGAMQERTGRTSESCQWESTSEPEYQMMGNLESNDPCIQQGVRSKVIGERMIL